MKELSQTDKDIINAGILILRQRGRLGCCQSVSYFEIGDLDNIEYYTASGVFVGEVGVKTIFQYLEMPCP